MSVVLLKSKDRNGTAANYADFHLNTLYPNNVPGHYYIGVQSIIMPLSIYNINQYTDTINVEEDLSSNPISITAISTAELVTTSVAHGFFVGDAVAISASNSTPSFDGSYIIATVPTTTTFTVTGAPDVTVAGTSAQIDSTNRLIGLTNGNYTASGLATALQTLLNDTSTLTYTVTYSSTTLKFTISVSTDAFALTWTTCTNPMSRILGFDHTADTASGTSVTSGLVARVEFLDYAQLHMDGFTECLDTSYPGVASDTMILLPLTEAVAAVQTYLPPVNSKYYNMDFSPFQRNLRVWVTCDFENGTGVVTAPLLTDWAISLIAFPVSEGLPDESGINKLISFLKTALKSLLPAAARV